MEKRQKEEHSVEFRLYRPADQESLLRFLNKLPEETRKNFAPHEFTSNELSRLLHFDQHYLAFLALDCFEPIAYYLLKKGWLYYEWQRLRTYPVSWIFESVCTFAPVVGESYQNKGIGTKLFHHMSRELKSWGFEQIILWGGVKTSNIQAMQYYKKLGFQPLGEFEYHGNNLDMIYQI